MTPADLSALRALADAATPGPWRWELNLKHKTLHLCGGVPRFDLTVMDLQRWGMSGAVVRLRNPENGLDMMRPATQFAAPVPGREHHADWFQSLNHPDARFIEAAREAVPSLLAHVAAQAERIEALEAAGRLITDAAFVSDTQFVCPTAFEPGVRALRRLLGGKEGT